MKTRVLPVILVLLLSSPGLLSYKPPNVGSPGSSQGSGTRLHPSSIVVGE